MGKNSTRDGDRLFATMQVTAQKITLFLVCVVLTLVTARIYLQPGVPYSHDGENHLARFANYRAALREGQFPPRFAPNLENGYGYPVFNYNYPLPNILSIPLTITGLSYELAFKLIVLSALSGGAYGLLLWFNSFSFSKTARVSGLLVWLASPFLLSTLAFRGSIGELLVYGMVPVLLLSCKLLVQQTTPRARVLHALVWSAFFLAHNVSVLWLTPVLILYFLTEWFQAGRSKQTLSSFLLVFIMAVGVSLWFWLPAVAEMSVVVLSGAQNATAFAQHFPSLRQLLFAPMQFGYSYPGSVDNLSFALGVSTWIAILLFPIWMMSYGLGLVQTWRKYSVMWWAWVLLVVLMFLQLKASLPVWNVLPLARFIQFPWRVALLMPTLAAVLIGHIVSSATPSVRKLALAVLIVIWLLSTRVQPLEWLHEPDSRYDSFTLNTTTQNENRTRTFTFQDIANNPRQPLVLDGAATVDVSAWNGSARSYTVQAQQPVVIIEPTMRFPGWETTASGLTVDYIDSPEIGGRIAYSLPAGDHQIKTFFTQRTPARRIGNVVSLFTIVWLVCMWIYSGNRKVAV